MSDTALSDFDATLATALGRRSIVMVGMMGAGKSSIGKRLAARLGIPFIDADAAIEEAAGMSVADIFEAHGEPSFRSGEARVIARLLDNGPQVLATGGGAFVNPETRERIHERGISVWLKADMEVLVRRVLRRRNDRPLIRNDDPTVTLTNLLAAREPYYSQANLTVVSRDVPHEIIVEEIVTLLWGKLGIACCHKDSP
jgi:shikimate kinase